MRLKLQSCYPWFIRVAVALHISVLTLSWSALTLSELGYYRGGLCALLGGLAAAIVVGYGGWKREWFASGGGLERTWHWVLAIALASLFLTTPPSEMILGGWDPGVYLHTAATIVREGSLQFDIPDLTALEGLEKELLARNLYGISEPFGGMRVLPDGRTSPQFYHAYPALLAVAWSGGGVWAALAVNPVLNVGCIVLAGALAARLFRGRWAVVAALLLCLNPAQIWQAKFSTAEILAQYFLLAGFVSWAVALEHPRSLLWPVLGGCSLGMAYLTRYDSLLVLVPFAALVLVHSRRLPDRRAGWLVLVILAAAALQAWAHQQFVAPYYQPLGGTVIPVVAAIFAAALAWLVLCLTPFERRLTRWVERGTPIFRRCLALLFVAWFAFAWFVRPHLDTQRLDARLIQRLFDALRLHDAYAFLVGSEANNMYYLSAILGPLGLALAAVGLAFLILRERRIGVRLWLYAAVATLGVLVTHVFHDHFLMWVARRYVPVAVPLLVMGVVGAMVLVYRKAGLFGVRFARGVTALLLTGVIAGHASATATVVRERDWPGLVAWFNNVAASIPEEALVFTDQDGFAAPLRFMNDKRAYELHFARRGERRRKLYAIMGRRAAEGEEVLYLSTHPPPELEDTRFEPVASFPMSTTILHRSRRMPETTIRRGGAFVLYRVWPHRD